MFHLSTALGIKLVEIENEVSETWVSEKSMRSIYGKWRGIGGKIGRRGNR
jgi:hypothetical protein